MCSYRCESNGVNGCVLVRCWDGAEDASDDGHQSLDGAEDRVASLLVSAAVVLRPVFLILECEGHPIGRVEVGRRVCQLLAVAISEDDATESDYLRSTWLGRERKFA